MKGKLLGLALLAAGTIFAGPRIAIGVQIGGPYGYYAPPPVYAYVPPCHGPGYAWVGGSWYSSGPRRLWRPGYWAAPAYAPRYYRDRGYRDDDHHDRYYRREYRRDRGRLRGWHR